MTIRKTSAINFAVFFLFLLQFRTLKCSVFYGDGEKQCKVNLNDGINKCEFNFQDGSWRKLFVSLPAIHNCINQCSHNEYLFHFKNYSLPAFPNATFSNLQNGTLKLEISNGSRIALLSPSLPMYSIFQNSSFNSVIFDISDSSTLIGWNWTVLQDLTIVSNKGFEINIVRSKLVYLHSDFNKAAKGHITVVRILKCEMKWLGKNIFAPLVSLKSLELRDNLLKFISRSHLPRHGSGLRVLDLGKNRLKSLPPDIFDGLNLQSVLLDGNRLKISEMLMENIVNNNQHLAISGAIWPCKCDAAFILKFLKSLYDAECYDDVTNDEIFYFRQMCLF
ncbi:hypothetical protein AVEN_116494-1 [Araneus ventricosus]|uniref:Uncharacterized protein n=1 Tax=Araneus ventricosus TaxID=182803 RepID=A0A4Y2NC30_ARAVE|nr:hypothetical protein AVEN_116494-1 [Araneus ventricosus]